jgi:hypothetical protein
MSNDDKKKDPYQGIPIQRLDTVGRPMSNKGHRFTQTRQVSVALNNAKVRAIIKVLNAKD